MKAKEHPSFLSRTPSCLHRELCSLQPKLHHYTAIRTWLGPLVATGSAFSPPLCPWHQKRRLQVLHPLLEELPPNQPQGRHRTCGKPRLRFGFEPPDPPPRPKKQKTSKSLRSAKTAPQRPSSTAADKKSNSCRRRVWVNHCRSCRRTFRKLLWREPRDDSRSPKARPPWAAAALSRS